MANGIAMRLCLIVTTYADQTEGIRNKMLPLMQSCFR